MIGRPSPFIVAGCVLLVAVSLGKHCEAQNLPTPAPTSACSSELAAWAGCIEDNNLNGELCVDCYDGYVYVAFVVGQPTCGEITSQICQYIDVCQFSCGASCAPFIEEYEACHWGSDCFYGCPYSEPIPSFPTSPVAPAPTVASPGTFPPAVAPALSASSAACADVASAFAGCVNSSGEGEAACLSCIQEYVPAFIDTCNESELYTCSAIEACPACGNCQAEFTTMINCDNQNVCGTITCPAAAPTAAPSLAAGTSTSPVVSPPSPVSIPTAGEDGGSDGDGSGGPGPSAPPPSPTAENAGGASPSPDVGGGTPAPAFSESSSSAAQCRFPLATAVLAAAAGTAVVAASGLV